MAAPDPVEWSGLLLATHAAGGALALIMTRVFRRQGSPTSSERLET